MRRRARHGRSRRSLDHLQWTRCRTSGRRCRRQCRPSWLWVEWSVVGVELARLVSWTVVVRVTDRRHAAVGHAPHATVHLESARDLVDHPASLAEIPIPRCTAPTPAKQNKNNERLRGEKMINMVRRYLSSTLTLVMCADAQAVSLFMIFAVFYQSLSANRRYKLQLCTFIIALASQNSCGGVKDYEWSCFDFIINQSPVNNSIGQSVDPSVGPIVDCVETVVRSSSVS